MSAYVIDSQLFCDQFGTPQMRRIFSDASVVQRWLDVEAALALVQGELGIIPQEAAAEIQRKARVELLDLAELKIEMDRTSHPIVPLLRMMKKICAGDSGEYIHWGATTQDITDTGTVLQIKDALDEIDASMRRLHAATSTLAARYRDQVMVGRSHGQQALPITFGYKVAVWVDEIRRNLHRLEQMKERVLQGQFSGAVGSLAALGQDGIAVQRALFAQLGLACPNISWHVARDGIAELISVLAICASTAGKIAHEIYCLQKTEVAELEEPFAMGKVGSSTMPHKRNPPACETIIALARLVRSSLPTAMEAVGAEHERDKVVLQTEREFIPRVFSMTHAALQKLTNVIAGLSVRSANMEHNLYLQKGLLMSEAVMMGLSQALGRQEAHELVYRLCMQAFESGQDLRSALLAEPALAKELSATEIEALLEPHSYTGMCGRFVDEVLQQELPA